MKYYFTNSWGETELLAGQDLFSLSKYDAKCQTSHPKFKSISFQAVINTTTFYIVAFMCNFNKKNYGLQLSDQGYYTEFIIEDPTIWRFPR